MFKIALCCLSWGRQLKKTRKQHPPCALLELPIDVVLVVAERLPLGNQVVLARTCRALHVAVHKLLHRNRVRLSRDEHFDYLACVARGSLNEWVCEKCVKLHHIALTDTPGTLRSMICMWDWSSISFLGETPKVYSFHHRYVQLALKYTRAGDNLGIKHRAYLERLLAPIENVRHCSNRAMLVVPLRFSVYPRVVGGRFLLLTVWRYYDETGVLRISWDAMSSMGLCRHQYFAWHHTTHYYPLLREDREIIRTMVQAANAPDGAEAHGACPHCPTDFAVQASPESVVVRVWQDLGTEGSPTDAGWQSLTSKRVRVDHRPGSVRELFESGEQETANTLQVEGGG